MGCCGTEKEEPSLSNSKPAPHRGTVTAQPGQQPVLEKPMGYFQQPVSQLPQAHTNTFPNAAYQQQQSTGPQWGQNEYGSFNTATSTTFNGSAFNQGFPISTSTSPMSNLPAAMARMSQYPVEAEKDEGKMSVSIDFGKYVVFLKKPINHYLPKVRHSLVL